MSNCTYILILILLLGCKNSNHEDVNTIQNINTERLEIKDSVFSKENQLEKISELKERFYDITIHDFENTRDTTVTIGFLKNDKTLDFTFNYEPLDKVVFSDSISLVKEDIEVVIIKSQFDKTKSKIKYQQDSITITEIDGHTLIGAEETPNEYISDFYIKIKNSQEHK